MKLSMYNGNDGEGSLLAAPYTIIIGILRGRFWGGDTSVPIFEIGTPDTDNSRNAGGILGIKNPPSIH